VPLPVIAYESVDLDDEQQYSNMLEHEVIANDSYAPPLPLKHNDAFVPLLPEKHTCYTEPSYSHLSHDSPFDFQALNNAHFNIPIPGMVAEEQNTDSTYSRPAFTDSHQSYYETTPMQLATKSPALLSSYEDTTIISNPAYRTLPRQNASNATSTTYSSLHQAPVQLHIHVGSEYSMLQAQHASGAYHVDNYSHLLEAPPSYSEIAQQPGATSGYLEYDHINVNDKKSTNQENEQSPYDAPDDEPTFGFSDSTMDSIASYLGACDEPVYMNQSRMNAHQESDDSIMALQNAVMTYNQEASTSAADDYYV
jgi:hypothetical protein